MPENTFRALMWLLLTSLLVAYAFYVRQTVKSAIRRAEIRGAKNMRRDAVQLAQLHANVAPANYQSVYQNIAAKLAELPLD